MPLVILVVSLVLAVLAANTRLPQRVRAVMTVALVLLLVATPILTDSTSALFDALTAMCVAYGWNLLGGFTGYASFGNAAYLGLGAFVAAGFMSRQPDHAHLPWFIGILLAVAIVSIVAALIGLVVLRLRGSYFSIATLGIFVAVPQVVNWDLFFGPQGPLRNFFGGGLPLNFPLASDATLFGRVFPSDQFFFYYLGLSSAIIAFALSVVVTRSKFGYSLFAIRENEEAAEVMGINVTRSKVGSYVLSAALAALGGAVIGYHLTNMTTESEALFSTINNLQMIIICLIGGIGTIWGPCIGALALFGIEEALRTFSSGGDFLQWQAVVFSIVIITVVLLLPRGIMQLARNRFSLKSLGKA